MSAGGAVIDLSGQSLTDRADCLYPSDQSQRQPLSRPAHAGLTTRLCSPGAQAAVQLTGVECVLWCAVLVELAFAACVFCVGFFFFGVWVADAASAAAAGSARPMDASRVLRLRITETLQMGHGLRFRSK